MAIYHRRQPCLLFVLIFGSIFLIYQYNRINKYFLNDEHRIYTSLLIELPHLERLIRFKQANLSSTQNRLHKVEKHLSKYTWQLNRLIKTIDYNKEQQSKIYRSNPFDFDLEKNSNHSKFLLYFHSINISNNIDYHILNQFHSKISLVKSPYLTLNKNEAYLHVIYLPIRSNNPNICYKDLINRKYFVLYEFINDIDEEIDEKCFGGNFLPVKFFTRFDTNQTFINNDRWRFNDEQRPSIGIVYLKTNCKF